MRQCLGAASAGRVGSVSTRALIMTALATGMVILIAFAVQVAIAL